MKSNVKSEIQRAIIALNDKNASLAEDILINLVIVDESSSFNHEADSLLEAVGGPKEDTSESDEIHNLVLDTISKYKSDKKGFRKNSEIIEFICSLPFPDAVKMVMVFNFAKTVGKLSAGMDARQSMVRLITIGSLNMFANGMLTAENIAEYCRIMADVGNDIEHKGPEYALMKTVAKVGKINFSEILEKVIKSLGEFASEAESACCLD